MIQWLHQWVNVEAQIIFSWECWYKKHRANNIRRVICKPQNPVSLMYVSSHHKSQKSREFPSEFLIRFQRDWEKFLCLGGWHIGVLMLSCRSLRWLKNLRFSTQIRPFSSTFVETVENDTTNTKPFYKPFSNWKKAKTGIFRHFLGGYIWEWGLKCLVGMVGFSC